MSCSRKTSILFALLTIPVLALGCGENKTRGDPEMIRRTAELAEIYEIYMMYSKTNQRPPKQLSDLNQKEFQGIYPVGLTALKKGDYVALWGVTVGDKGSGTVLAYEKDAPKQGGYVIMADGATQKMSADDLQAALKSKN